MAVNYPCKLPGVLVNSNGVSPQPLVRSNDVANGPPRFRLEAESGWLQFNVAWSFNALEAQVFENWFKHSLTSGSKSALIDLNVPGGLLEHECYFIGAPSYNSVGKRWSVSGTLLAIERVGLDECDSESLLITYEVFESPNLAITQMDAAIVELEASWLA
jgi:hypothetical protein